MKTTKTYRVSLFRQEMHRVKNEITLRVRAKNQHRAVAAAIWRVRRKFDANFNAHRVSCIVLNYLDVI